MDDMPEPDSTKPLYRFFERAANDDGELARVARPMVSPAPKRLSEVDVKRRTLAFVAGFIAGVLLTGTALAPAMGLRFGSATDEIPRSACAAKWSHGGLAP